MLIRVLLMVLAIKILSKSCGRWSQWGTCHNSPLCRWALLVMWHGRIVTIPTYVQHVFAVTVACCVFGGCDLSLGDRGEILLSDFWVFVSEFEEKMGVTYTSRTAMGKTISYCQNIPGFKRIFVRTCPPLCWACYANRIVVSVHKDKPFKFVLGLVTARVLLEVVFMPLVCLKQLCNILWNELRNLRWRYMLDLVFCVSACLTHVVA